jgi:hypothetical protein
LDGHVYLWVANFMRRAARAARDRGNMAELRRDFTRSSLRLSSLEQIGSDVIARFDWKEPDGTARFLWARAGAKQATPETPDTQSREARLRALIADVQRRGGNAAAGPPGSVRLDSDVDAIFSGDEREVRSKAITKSSCSTR